MLLAIIVGIWISAWLLENCRHSPSCEGDAWRDEE